VFFLFSIVLLSEGTYTECLIEWGKIFNSQANSSQALNDYRMMFQYSGFTPNSIGYYDGCNKIDIARYTVIGLAESPLILQAVCGPIKCKKDYYKNTTFPFYKGYPALVEFPHKYQTDHYKHYDSGPIAMLVVTSLISFLVVVATAADFFIKNSIRNLFVFKLLQSFSMIFNVKKLLTTRSQDRLGEKDSLEILNAVRVFSIGWVILGHTLLNYISIVPLTNFTDFYKEFKDSRYILVYTAFYAVDTFFWMSGLLMAYLFINEFDKIKGSPAPTLILTYVHRFLRITPVYMFCLFFFWALMPYFGNGPFWFDVTNNFNPDCHKRWWSNLLYVNNFVPHWKTSSCLGQSWYLANDMQFFMISPVILIIYMKINKLLSWGIIVGLNILGIITSAVIAHHFNLNPVIFSADNKLNYFNYYYTKPYCRVPPYAIGLACGMILFSYRQYKKTGRIYDKLALSMGKAIDNIYIRYSSFFVGFCIINFLIFFQYDTYKHPGDVSKYHHWSNNERYSFIALQRVAYALGLSLVLMPMLLGYMKFPAQVLSAYIWSVMARITFVMYLIHYAIITICLRSTKTSIEFDEYNNIRDSFYFFFLSFVCAIPIVLAVEMPSINLERMMFSSFKKKEEENEEDRKKSLLLEDFSGSNTKQKDRLY
jgi:peptidoglycan/LPS O-acetylase OafA/YrhL